MKILRHRHFHAVALLLFSSLAMSATAIETRPIEFAKGASSATLKGSLKGSQTIDYTVRAQSGQTMSVTLATSNSSNYFNVLPPGSNDVAVFIGSSGGNQWTGSLDASGEYKIRVYLMRSAARRSERANFTLTVAVTGSVSATRLLGTPPASDAKVDGTPFHATGEVSCSMGSGQPVWRQCRFGVIRGQPGNAHVHLTKPDGASRVLTFIAGSVTTEQGATLAVVKRDDSWVVDINGSEHYRIPDAVITGG